MNPTVEYTNPQRLGMDTAHIEITSRHLAMKLFKFEARAMLLYMVAHDFL